MQSLGVLRDIDCLHILQPQGEFSIGVGAIVGVVDRSKHGGRVQIARQHSVSTQAEIGDGAELIVNHPDDGASLIGESIAIETQESARCVGPPLESIHVIGMSSSVVVYLHNHMGVAPSTTQAIAIDSNGMSVGERHPHHDIIGGG